MKKINLSASAPRKIKLQYSYKFSTNAISKRKRRSDRIIDIKFPVTPEQRKVIRAQAFIEQITETKLTTRILFEALEKFKEVPDQFPILFYKDTKQYMHLKPTQRKYKEIFDIALYWNISIRQAAHRLLINQIQLGEFTDPRDN